MQDKIEVYVNKFKDGEEKAFDDVYNATNNTLYKVLYSYTKNEQLSFDLMQETYIVFYNKAYMIEKPGSVQSWLNRVAINKANRYFNTKNRDVLINEENEDIFESVEDPDVEFLPQEILDNKEQQKIIRDIIDNLSDDQKAAVYMYYFNEMSLAEIAEEMECSQGTIKSRLNYARKKIKTEVDTWEKKGTKLYSAGIPVLILILRSQIEEAKAMDLNKAVEILDNIKSSNIGTSHMGSMKNIHKGISGKVISSCIAGGLAVSVAAGYFIYNNNVDNLAADNKKTAAVEEKIKEEPLTSSKAEYAESKENADEEPECGFYWTYAELGIDSVTSLSVSDSNVLEAFDFKNDKCIGADLKDNLGDVDKDSAYINVNGRQLNLFFDGDIWNQDVRDENSERRKYISFKELGRGNTEEISVSDNSIVDVTLNKEEKYILIKHKGVVGSSVITATNDKGENATIEIECSQDLDGTIYFSKECITCR